MTEATSLRHGLPASVVDFKVSRGIVAKICFTDGICWAAKMRKIAHYPRGTIYAIRALKLLHQYCPNIPTPKFKGYSQHKIIYYFTDCIEGSTLDARWGTRLTYRQSGYQKRLSLLWQSLCTTSQHVPFERTRVTDYPND